MKQLPPETVRLLSSSQVITSVVSVVKELIENSLDANATAVDIKLENYGFDKIEVRDNGDGIKAADVPVMAMKHYTSKISSTEDLERLTTYGFRGEALGSICTMSEVAITTKTADDDFSTQYSLDRSGHVTSQKPSHLGQGTTVTVLKLFKNLPVRKQFYSTDKKCKEEIKNIQKLLMAYGIIKPELRITFTHNKALIWQKSKVMDHKMAFMAVVGPAVMGNMVPFEHHCEDPEVFLSGFLPKPDSDHCLTSHSNADRSFIFVNNRPICQKEILKLAQQYNNQRLHKDSSRLYPVFLISITIPPSALDVNLTPDKSQVLLHNKESICLAMDDVFTSLYGHLYETTTSKTNNTDATVREQTSLHVNETKSSQPIDSRVCAPLFSFPNETGKNTEVCLENQTLCNISAQAFPRKTDISGNETAGSDGFEDGSYNMLLFEDQNNSKVIYNKDNNTLMDIPSENKIEDCLGNGLCQETEKGERAVILKDYSEDTADKWSLGVAFKNSRGENLNPVHILIPETEGVRPQTKNNEDAQQKPLEKDNIQTMKKTKFVNDKVGQIKAYDMINSQIIKKPTSAFDFFVQDHRPGLLSKNIKASAGELMLKMEEIWKALKEEERKKYEEKAVSDLERYNRQSRKAKDELLQRSAKQKTKRLKAKLKDCLSSQLKLDTLFHSMAEKKNNTCQATKTVQVTFSMASLKHKLRVLEQTTSDKDEPCFIHLLNFPDAWIVASETNIIMLNPYRVEEALLFKRLLENHKLPIEKLEKPITLNDSLLGGSHYLDVLCNMPKKSVQFDGSSYLLDPRLTANGFKIKILPGASAVESELEIEGMANCLPYYGIEDLKEILSAVVNNNAKEVHECRPLKVINYLEGEAVRLSRQLPLYLSKEDVQDTISRMKKQLGNQHKNCVHGRPLTHYLTEVPQSNKQKNYFT